MFLDVKIAALSKPFTYIALVNFFEDLNIDVFERENWGSSLPIILLFIIHMPVHENMGKFSNGFLKQTTVKLGLYESELYEILDYTNFLPGLCEIPFNPIH